MNKKIKLSIPKQPDDTSCGPTCLYSLYQYWNEKISLNQVIKEIPQFEDGGGTLAVILANHALSRGFQVSLHSFNLNIFDPSWFQEKPEIIVRNLEKRLQQKKMPAKEKTVLKSYIAFLKNGGSIKFGDLTPSKIKQHLNKDIPLLIGLSATWLYQCKRENPLTNKFDDITGDPAGHFVVACDYNTKDKTVLIADPYVPNPIAGEHYYRIPIHRLISSILLGIMTFDGNIVIIEKGKNETKHHRR